MFLVILGSRRGQVKSLHWWRAGVVRVSRGQVGSGDSRRGHVPVSAAGSLAEQSDRPNDRSSGSTGDGMLLLNCVGSARDRLTSSHKRAKNVTGLHRLREKNRT